MSKVFLKNSWETKRLVECTKNNQIPYGIVQPGQETEFGIPVIRVNNFKNGEIDTTNLLKVKKSISDKHRKTILKGGEVLLTIVGTTGLTSIVPEKFAGYNVARAVAVIDPIAEIGPTWIDIILKSIEARDFLDSRANTTVQKTLNLSILNELPIPIPPKEVRHKIEYIYLAINNKIKLNNKINFTLELLTQAVFKSWFIDFDPVHAKKLALEAGLTKDQSERAAMAIISGFCSPSEFAENFKEMDELLSQRLSKMSKDKQEELAHTASLFPSEFEDSEIGDIPSGWRIGGANELTISIKSGGTPSRSINDYWANGKVPWLGSGEIRNRWITSTKEFITDEGLRKSSASLFPKYTTLVAMYGATAGEVGISNFTLTTNQACCGLVPKPNYEGYNFFLFSSIISELKNLANGAAQQNISQTVIKDYKFKLPSTLLIEKFNCLSFSMLEKTFLNVEENTRLEKLRDVLLPKLLSGEIDVSEVSID